MRMLVFGLTDSSFSLLLKELNLPISARERPTVLYAVLSLFSYICIVEHLCSWTVLCHIPAQLPQLCSCVRSSVMAGSEYRQSNYIPSSALKMGAYTKQRRLIADRTEHRFHDSDKIKSLRSWLSSTCSTGCSCFSPRTSLFFALRVPSALWTHSSYGWILPISLLHSCLCTQCPFGLVSFFTI